MITFPFRAERRRREARRPLGRLWPSDFDDDDGDGGDHDDGNGDGDGDGSPAHRLTVDEQFVNLLLLRLSKSLLSCWSSNCRAQDVKRCLGNVF